MVQGRGWKTHERAQKTEESPGQLFPYIRGKTEVQSCLLEEKILGKCKKLASEPFMLHLSSAFQGFVIYLVVSNGSGATGKMQIPSNAMQS